MAAKNKSETALLSENTGKDATVYTNEAATPAEKRAAIVDLYAVISSSLSPDATVEAIAKRDALFERELRLITHSHNIFEKYNLLFLYDDTSLVRSDADAIYKAFSAFPDFSKPILLTLHSPGGSIAPAYLIGKLCREFSDGKFCVAVPRQAKSAATLISCAADEIHMGTMSELGPIDPQINGLPALGLKNSIEHLAELVRDYPTSSDMFAKYLNLSLEPIHIGYYERVAESAAQYAERLLSAHAETLDNSPQNIAKTLVYSYKDHGFVIDKSEAIEIFGKRAIVVSSPEYDYSNDIYEFLDTVKMLADFCNHSFYFRGGLGSQPTFRKKK